MISQFHQIFKIEKLKLQLTPYEIKSLGPEFGLIEFVQDAATIHQLKKIIKNKYPMVNTLKDFYKYFYGRKKSKKARKNFCKSLAAYSLLTYILQIKDRHNENILINKKTGSILHIDFGFFLSNAPGGKVQFEKPKPFKLLSEYVEVLNGQRSMSFRYFRKLLFK